MTNPTLRHLDPCVTTPTPFTKLDQVDETVLAQPLDGEVSRRLAELLHKRNNPVRWWNNDLAGKNDKTAAQQKTITEVLARARRASDAGKDIAGLLLDLSDYWNELASDYIHNTDWCAVSALREQLHELRVTEYQILILLTHIHPVSPPTTA